MELPDHATKLSVNDCKLLEELIQCFPKTGVELTLVASGVKPGDVIRSYEPDMLKSALSFVAAEIRVNVKKFSSGDLIYYNELVDDELLKNVTEVFENKKEDIVPLGIFYGWHKACGEAKKNGTALKYSKPYTEHYWCKEDCEHSLRMVELYKEAILLNAPDYMPLIERFHNLSNNTAKTTLIQCEFMNVLNTNFKNL